ncbi:MAG TPA: efflux RND transporter periplasmic adaptor subunit [Tepidisphaeraceae bacterium]|jgi:RND family efflux transporter MFP subunit
MSTTQERDRHARLDQPELPGPAEHPLLPPPAKKDGAPPPGKDQGKDDHKGGEHHDEHNEHEVPKDLPQVKTWAVILAGIIIAACLVGLFLLGFIPREKRLHDLKAESQKEQDTRPRVQVQKPTVSPSLVDVRLPADVTPYAQTAIFPQISGYLSKWNFDIGQHVHAGELMALISAPDIDAQLLQAKANVAQQQSAVTRAEDNYSLAKATLARYEGFFKQGGITQQQLDQYRTNFTQAEADLAGAQANLKAGNATVQRYASLQAYEKIIAPFPGTVTVRNYDAGALMTAGNAVPGKEIFDLVDSSVLRVFVDVDQVYVTSAHVGDPAALEVRNYPGREFAGTITRIAGALDPATRKMRYEIDVPNPTNELYPGMYGQVVLKVKQSKPLLLVPTSALIFDAQGTRLWTVRGDQAYVRNVTVGRDFGTMIEIPTGIDASDEVVTNPGEQLGDGTKVDVTHPSTTAPAGSQQSTTQTPTTQP